jgi:hypothetical protein
MSDWSDWLVCAVMGDAPGFGRAGEVADGPGPVPVTDEDLRASRQMTLAPPRALVRFEALPRAATPTG